MTTITLQQLHEDLVGMKKELIHIKTLLEEEFELADDVVHEIEQSRKRPKVQFISHEVLRNEISGMPKVKPLSKMRREFQ